MNDDKNLPTSPSSDTNNENNDDEKVLNVKNPFNKNDNKKITAEDLESVQESKEAQTERD
ncbi:MAG: hypothetical protein JO072_07965 [Parafilimonas sp.]|nr:hypothetical protein [Parafilimonas sp.]